MKTASVLTAAVAVISAEVEGRNLVVNQPRATGTAVLPDDGVSPKPTSPPPGLDHLPPGGMFRRALPSNTLLTAMIAPDNTCGWISASVAVPYTCGAGATCGLVLAQKTFSGVVMCFNDVAYNFRFGCIDYNSYFSSSACDHLCAENTQVMKCTESATPYCNTIAFPGGVTDYWCNSINYSTAQLAQTTWRGQTDARIYTRIVQPLTSSAVFFSTPRSVTNLAPTATNAENSGGASETGGVGNGNGNGSGSGNDRGRKTPVGAIVGGIVGGVAAIGLGLGLLALFLFLRRKKSKAAGQTETPPSNQSPMQPGASPGIGMPMTQAYHDPKFSASPPLPQEYPPQQQYPHTTHTTPPPQGGGYYPQQSLGPSSPTASHMTDPRMSHITTSPTPTPANAYATPPPDQLPQPQPQPQPQQQQQQPGGFQPVPGQQHYGQRPHTQAPPPGPVHEAPAQTGDNHRGQMHELG